MSAKKAFLDSVIPHLHQLESRADNLLEQEQKRKVWEVTVPIRAMVCEIADAIDRGEEVKARIRHVKTLIKLAL